MKKKLKKLNFSSSLNPFNILIGGGFTDKQNNIINNKINESNINNDYSNNSDKLLKCYFKKYPNKIEQSGNVRLYFGDEGANPFFELFIWVKDKNVLKFDLHYDIYKNERQLSWNKNNSIFLHSFINSEKENNIGVKKIQTQAESTNFNLEEIKNKFEIRLNKNKENNDNFIEIIELVYKIILGKFSIE